MTSLLLKRIELAKGYTLGELYINGKFFCHTLEDENRDLNKNGVFDGNEVKIAGETCIPFGKYDIEMRYSPTYSPKYGGRKVPYLLKVPHFDGILIHVGNYPKDTRGCILVGRKATPGMISHSKDTLYSLLDELDKETGKITIEIR